MVAAEAAPWAKVGGLADVVVGLSRSLADRGHTVSLAIPAYDFLTKALSGKTDRPLPIDYPLFERLGVRVLCIPAHEAPWRTLYLIATDRWFGDCTRSEEIYISEPEAYVTFAKACALLCHAQDLGEPVEVVHTHDWHPGLLPVYLHQSGGQGPAVIHTVHNMAYTGTFAAGVYDSTGLPQELFTWDKLEFFGGFSFLKAAMVYADIVNTVSRTYAQECRRRDIGGGLAGLADYLAKNGRFVGITNGLDTRTFDPASDRSLPANYDAANLANRALCKQMLQADLHLRQDPKAPVVGMVSRICEQKGHDILLEALDGLVSEGFQFAILGVGDAAMTEGLRRAQQRHPDSVAVRIGFDAYLANRIYAGSDMFLMPSRFEPCGLGQLIAMRYGSLPVVRRTGGLADTVRDADEHPRTGNGFVFNEASADGVRIGLRRALAAYRDSRRWRRIQLCAMQEDHSWDHVAPAYEAIYERALRRAARRHAAP